MRARWQSLGDPARWIGPLLAISAALAFALSVPVSKVLLRDASPLALAALLYLGAGIALTLIRLPAWFTRIAGRAPAGRGGAAGRASDWLWLLVHERRRELSRLSSPAQTGARRGIVRCVIELLCRLEGDWLGRARLRRAARAAPCC
jgi:hypothetical protein